MSDATAILSAVERGEPKAAEQLLVVVYDELRRLAPCKMAREAPGQTLQPTELVHEDWTFARTWILHEIEHSQTAS